MTPATALLLVAVGAHAVLAAVLLLAVAESRSTRAHNAGRRDQRDRCLDESRMGRDRNYTAGAVDEWFAQHNTRQGGPR